MPSPAIEIVRLEAELKALREDFDQMTSVVAQQAQIIRNFEDERQRQLGARGAIKFIWAFLTTGVAGVAYSLHDILMFFWPPKGH